MMKKIKFTKEQLMDQGLSSEEAELALDAWDEFQEEKNLTINTQNICSNLIVNNMLYVLNNSLLGELVYRAEIDDEFNLSNSYDKFKVIEGVKKELESNINF